MLAKAEGVHGKNMSNVYTSCFTREIRSQRQSGGSRALEVEAGSGRGYPDFLFSRAIPGQLG